MKKTKKTPTPLKKEGMRDRLKRRVSDFWFDLDCLIDVVFDWMMSHDLLVRIVSSIIGSLLGIWLVWGVLAPYLLTPLIVQR